MILSEHTVCTLSAHCLYTVCTLSVHCLHTVCTHMVVDDAPASVMGFTRRLAPARNWFSMAKTWGSRGYCTQRGRTTGMPVWEDSKNRVYLRRNEEGGRREEGGGRRTAGSTMLDNAQVLDVRIMRGGTRVTGVKRQRSGGIDLRLQIAADAIPLQRTEMDALEVKRGTSSPQLRNE